MNKIFLGVNSDTRTLEQLESVPKHEEIAGTLVPSYLPDQQTASKYVDFFPYENQYETGECMPHGHLLVLTIFSFIHGDETPIALSPTFIYRQRSNYPNPGMAEGDVQAIINKGVITLENCPTPQNDEEANAVTITPDMQSQILPISGITWVEPGGVASMIDALAIVSNTFGLGSDILIFATEEEWSQQNVSIITANLQWTDPTAVVQHCVTVLPNSAFTNPSGKRCVIIQDSFSILGGFRTRILDEDFIATRVKTYSYIVELAKDSIQKPTAYNFTRVLAVGSTGDDVNALQSWLQFLGFMPTSVNGQTLKPTGYYGGITKQAVLDFQNAHPAEILTPNNLTVGTGYFGNSTRAYLNTLSN